MLYSRFCNAYFLTGGVNDGLRPFDTNAVSMFLIIQMFNCRVVARNDDYILEHF